MNLNQIEQKAFRSFYQDGLWDMFLGIGAIALYISGTFLTRVEPEWLQYAILFGLFFGISFLMNSLKKNITIPRLGQVNFSAKRTKNRRRSILINMIALIISGGALLYIKFLQPGSSESSGNWIPAIVGLFIFTVFSFMAYNLDFPRLFIYGGMYAVAFTAIMTYDEPRFFLVLGFPIFGAGLFFFLRFIKKYPVLSAGEADV